jgi:hypothetical protein
MSFYSWRPYVSVAQRRANARKEMTKLAKKGKNIQPIELDGRKIATSYWGKAWCDHLESFSDYDNRLPRGRTYVRNGSVCHLEVQTGRVEALVSGSDLYKVVIEIAPLVRKTWDAIQAKCRGQIGSVLELLQGRLSNHVMGVVSDRKEGLFPQKGEIESRIHSFCFLMLLLDPMAISADSLSTCRSLRPITIITWSATFLQMNTSETS